MTSSIARYFLDPFHILLILIIVSFIARRFFRKRVFMTAVIAAGAWFLLITTPFLPYIVLNSLEKRYLPVNAQVLSHAGDLHIIVLGAGYFYNRDLPANSQLDKQMLARLAEGVRIYNHYPNS